MDDYCVDGNLRLFHKNAKNKVYKAWRAGKVLSLVNFDVKVAYNGVAQGKTTPEAPGTRYPTNTGPVDQRLLLRTDARILVNGYTSKQEMLPQAGLPQRSPLSPVLFLFFNVDLVQHKINSKGGSVVFVDDYTA